MINRVDLRKTHPKLWWDALVFAVLNIGLGVNLIFAKPTFLPYSAWASKETIGAAFIAVGAFILSTLALKDLKLIRVSMALCAAFMLWWGLGTSFTFFTGQTSLQLPWLYVGYVILLVRCCVEPFYNPLTGTNGKL